MSKSWFDIDRLVEPESAELILSANQRLALHLSQAFDQQQLAHKKPAWQPLRVLTLDAWLTDCWDRLRSISKDLHETQLLTGTQELILWESTIRRSPNNLIIKLSSTAKRAQSAYRTLLLWQQSHTDSSFSWQPDCAQFSDWAKRFERACKDKDVITHSQLAGRVLKSFDSGALPKVHKMILVGFDDLPPLHQALVEAAAQRIEYPLPSTTKAIRHRLASHDYEQEILAAAHWAQAQLAQQPQQRIGIVVPDLNNTRALIERTFSAVFEPQYLLPETPRYALPFNISAAVPLSSQPMINAAQQILALSQDEIETAQLLQLLHSPFVLNQAQDQNSVALIELLLRRTEVKRRTMAQLITALERISDKSVTPYVEALTEFTVLHEKHAGNKVLINHWIQLFESQLEALDWPGARSLDSIEFQQQKRWRAALEELADCEALLGKLSLTQALQALNHHISAASFQAESRPSPIQILGLLEAGGLSFDALWIVGMNNHVLPASTNPNPFIPVALQRQWDMPHANAQRELDFAEHLLEGYSQHADTLIASYALWEDDRALQASPLIQSWPDIREKRSKELSQDIGEPDADTSGGQSGPAYHPYYQSIYDAAQLESCADEKAPDYNPEQQLKGGSQILKNQSTCPFKAFAVHRLDAEALAEPTEYPGALERGVALHEALEYLWRRLKSQKQLIATGEDKLSRMITHASTHATQTLATKRPDLYNESAIELEQNRLERLLHKWLVIEKQRPAFSVHSLEQSVQTTLETLPFRLRLDRIDRLEDGSLLLIDYKSGQCNINQWQGERLEEPQLPLYCAALENEELEDEELEDASDRVSAIAFAQINAEEARFRGIGESPGIAKGILTNDKGQLELPDSWPDIKLDWRAKLKSLAREFTQGHAAVIPRDSKQCNYCHLQSVCRIGDQNP